MRSTLLALAMLVGLFFVTHGRAEAALRVCNTTNEPVSVAIAVLSPGTGGPQSQSEGWFQIDARACELVIDTDLNPTVRYYLFAKASSIAWSGSPSKTADASFCTNFAGRFYFIDRTSNVCTGAGEQMLRFINEPVGGPTWTIDLGSPS